MKIYEIPGKPVAWMRAGRKGNIYYDKQVQQKEQVKRITKIAMNALFPHSEGVKVIIEFHMPIPSSWSKIKQDIAVGKPHTSRPDTDNLMKFVADALNEVLWRDDCLIYEIHARKIYSTEPKTLICAEAYKGDTLPPIFPC